MKANNLSKSYKNVILPKLNKIEPPESKEKIWKNIKSDINDSVNKNRKTNTSIFLSKIHNFINPALTLKPVLATFLIVSLLTFSSMKYYYYQQSINSINQYLVTTLILNGFNNGDNNQGILDQDIILLTDI
jgi:hypothetical protein